MALRARSPAGRLDRVTRRDTQQVASPPPRRRARGVLRLGRPARRRRRRSGIVPQRDVRGLLLGVGGELRVRVLAGRVRRTVGGAGERDHGVAVLTGVPREVVAGQRTRIPARVEGMLEDVPASLHGVQRDQRSTEARCYRHCRCAPSPTDPGAAVPARASLDQRGAAADGQAARTAGPDRVLGLLPRQLAAHAPLHERVARALRRPRPARDRRSTPAASRPPATRRHVPRAVERLGIDYPVVIDVGSSSGTSTATRAGPPLPVGQRGSLPSSTTARAPTRRPSGRSRSCSESTSEPLSPCGRRTRRA